MMQEVVNPLAPMLKRLPEVPSQVGVLQSFTSTILAERGTWGWRGWEDDLNLMLHYAGLNPRVIYEDNVLKHNALDGIKILAMPNCDVLTESMVKAVKAFQKRGGIVIGDPDLCPEIVPQVRVKVFKRSSYADRTQASFYREAWKLHRELRRYLTINSDTDRYDLLRYERQWKNTSYYFVINDKRTYGDYLGFKLSFHSPTVILSMPDRASCSSVTGTPLKMPLSPQRTRSLWLRDRWTSCATST